MKAETIKLYWNRPDFALDDHVWQQHVVVLSPSGGLWMRQHERGGCLGCEPYNCRHYISIALYHPGSSDGLLALCLCLSVCFCVLAIMTQCSNAKSQPQWNVWLWYRLCVHAWVCAFGWSSGWHDHPSKAIDITDTRNTVIRFTRNCHHFLVTRSHFWLRVHSTAEVPRFSAINLLNNISTKPYGPTHHFCLIIVGFIQCTHSAGSTA